MNLTKRETPEDTIKKWAWLAEHPKASQEDYFDVICSDKNNTPFDFCYCCEYDNQQWTKEWNECEEFFQTCKENKQYKFTEKEAKEMIAACRNCPIRCWDGCSRSICIDINSPLKKWMSASGIFKTKKRQKYALQIIDLAKKALNELED